MYQIGDVVDVETSDFFGAVEIIDRNDDGTYQTIFYPEETVITVSDEDIVGFSCEER